MSGSSACLVPSNCILCLFFISCICFLFFLNASNMMYYNEDTCFLLQNGFYLIVQFSSVQLLSRVWLFETPWITARQGSLSITISRSSLKFTSIKSVMPSSHLILCHPLFLLPPTPPSIRVFSNESTLHIRWPKYWSFSFSIIPSKEHPGLISSRMDWLDLLAVQGLSRVFSNTTVQKHQFTGKVYFKRNNRLLSKK